MKIKFLKVWAIVNIPFLVGYWIISGFAPNLGWYSLFALPWMGTHIWVGNHIDWEYFIDE